VLELPVGKFFVVDEQFDNSEGFRAGDRHPPDVDIGVSQQSGDMGELAWFVFGKYGQ
jgi:hypothetical protein